MNGVAEPLSVVLAGGGTAGHVNPLLSLADALRRRDPMTRITVLGTAEGLEARLVPERGYELVTVPKAPLPRRPNRAVLAFPGALRGSIRTAGQALQEARADVVVGFGGYVSTPAYLAARRHGVPIVIHEQNARPGLANRLGARLTPHVATTFRGSKLSHGQWVGMPLRQEIATLDRSSSRAAGMSYFGLDPDLRTLLIFGGSLGAQRLNEAFPAAAEDFAAAGVQVLHLTGAGKEISIQRGAFDDSTVRYVAQPYTDRMDLAYAVADLAVCRSGAGTVCELAAVGLPAIYVPLPIGNGEQRLNAAEVVAAGGGLLVHDGDVTSDWVRGTVLPLMASDESLRSMSRAAAEAGQRDADETLVDLVESAAGRR
ncbi:MAG: undecaprenyldiphospho-muramoylpentapeptide beta-N-acetylglucosaminyltransferase [Ornithinimicrobium sp.]